MKKAALLSTIILLASIAGASQAASVVIDKGSEEANNEFGLYLQDTGKWACSSQINGTVYCESV